jgi:hypothetical protein
MNEHKDSHEQDYAARGIDAIDEEHGGTTSNCTHGSRLKVEEVE